MVDIYFVGTRRNKRFLAQATRGIEVPFPKLGSLGERTLGNG